MALYPKRHRKYPRGERGGNGEQRNGEKNSSTFESLSSGPHKPINNYRYGQFVATISLVPLSIVLLEYYRNPQFTSKQKLLTAIEFPRIL